MSLQLIIGSSGAGKSHLLNQRIVEQARQNPDCNYLVLVPEQFTMQTQREFVQRSEQHAIMNIDVLSFMRLAYRVFEECPGYDRVVLEDEGKSMVLRKLMQEQKDKLRYFKQSIHKPGFISEIKSVLSEFYQYDINEEQIDTMLAECENHPMLYHKLYDIRQIYHAYQEYLRGRYVAAEEILVLLGEAAQNSKLLHNCVLCLDGFTGFTPIQYNLLQQLLRVVDKMYITVTMDAKLPLWKKGKEHELFYLSQSTIHRCKEIAEQAGVELEDPILLGEKEPLWRFRKEPALAWLEQNLYRYPWKPYEGETSAIRLASLRNCEEEIIYTVSEMERLVREQGYRYREIAVVTGDINSYGIELAHAMEQAGIPYFLDQKKEITGNPLAEFILSLLELMSQNYKREPIIRLLRTGFVEIETEQVDALENYLLAKDIRGHARWTEEWVKPLHRNGEEELAQLNHIRQQVVNCLEPIWLLFHQKSTTVADYTNGLYEFLVSCQVYQKLELWRMKWEERGNAVLAKEYAQMYRIVLKLLEHLMELLGPEQIQIEEYTQLIQTGLEEGRVGIIPPGLDPVIIGDVQRTRLKDIRVLFVIGVNEGSIMGSSGGGGLLSDMDRELLCDKQFVLAPTAREQLYQEQFYLYLNLTKPSDALYLTYHRLDDDGKAVRMASLIGKVMSLFPKIEVEELSQMADVLGLDYGFHTVLEGMRHYVQGQMSKQERELFAYYYRQPELREKVLQYLEVAFFEGRESRLSETVAQALYGTNLQGSVSRMEQYAACAFSYYVQYGLGLRERAEYTLSLPDLGNVLHSMLENFSGRMRKENIGWSQLTQEQEKQWSEDALASAIEDYGEGIFDSSNRAAYMRNRMERIGKRAIWALARQMRQSDFQQAGYEMSFGLFDHLRAAQLRLNDGHTLLLQGRIDRVDRYEDDTDIFVNVVDYKTGKKTIQTTDIYYGLQLQLIVYMDAALEVEAKRNPNKEVHPGGMFYYQVKDPIVEVEEDSLAEGALLLEMVPSGMMNNRETLLQNMDHSICDENGNWIPDMESTVIPLRIDSKGQCKKNDALIEEKDFTVLRSFVRKRMTEFGDRILSGDISLKPYMDKKQTPCEYCNYRGICEFDTGFQKHTYRKLEKKTMDDIRKEDGEV